MQAAECWGRGSGCSARAHPTPRAFAGAPATTASPPGRGPHGADPPVASRGLCGVTGGGSPPRGRLLARRLPPLALDWSASAGRRSSAALGLPRGRQAPPHALRASGLAPKSPSPRVPRLSCPVLSPSHFCRVPCPLGATLPFGAPSLCPWGWGEKDAWGAGRGPRWLRGKVGGGGCGRTGGAFFLIKNLIKKFTRCIYSVLKHHTYCTGSAWKGPPLRRTATDSTMKGQQGALLPSFLPGWPPGF